MSEKKIWIWWKEGGDGPCVLQVGSPPRGPGKVYETTGPSSREEAVAAVARALTKVDDLDALEESDPELFLAIRKAQREVREVDLEKELEKGSKVIGIDMAKGREASVVEVLDA